MLKAIIVVSTLILLSAPTFARGYTCGIYMSAKNHVKPTPLALDWARRFPHTFAAPGAVVVQRRKGRALGGTAGGHVSQIISLTSPCRAIVNDNRGTYERDICRGLVAYVSPH